MSLIKEKELVLKKILNKLSYDDNVTILPCSKKELGDFQINVCLSLAKKYKKNPLDIASSIVSLMQNEFTSINISNPGFINFCFKESDLINYLNNSINDFTNLYDLHEQKTIFLDYGGANAAKALHVGHMRSPNIGEAMKRLANKLGYKTISDVHLGDLGRQAGMLISEIKKVGDYKEYFDDSNTTILPKVEYTSKDLARLYVNANLASKEDLDRLEEVRKITSEIDKGNEKYLKLWKQLINISLIDIKKVYEELNCHFDLWEGEMDSFQEVPNMLKKLDKYLYESDGALVIDVKEETDTKEVPPLIVIKKDGATIYATRDLATINSRENRFHPDEIWYFTDNRQSLYFEQIFRASYKGSLVPKTCKLLHFPFGTINGSDGKPFKTRDGGVMELSELIDIIKDLIDSKISPEFENREDIKEKLAIATLKYADLMSNRITDYNFDPYKFSSFDGKTGPYILYTVVRLKSILNKVKDDNYKIEVINNIDLKNILLKVLTIPSVLNHSFNEKSLNYITDFLFEFASLFNKFYNNYHILTESNIKIKNTYLAVCKLILNILENLLDILAIKTVDKM